MFPSALVVATLLGSLSVTVTDEAGMRVPGANVEVLREGAIDRHEVSNVDGSVEFGLLKPGSYVVRAHLEGFTLSETKVEVRPGAASAVQLPLAVDDLGWYWAMVGENPAPVGTICPVLPDDQLLREAPKDP